jgi:hypothetical protein
MVRSAYTLGKTMNMADQDGWVSLSYNAPDVFERNYAPAGFDRRHSFTLASTYSLPFGRGGSSLRKEIVRDWQVNGTFVAYSGRPFTVTASNSALDQRGNLQTADLVGELKRVGVGPDEPFYDTAAFANVTEQRYGTTGRNQFHGPGYWNVNMSVFRTFRLPQRKRLQVRIEGFNVQNLPIWGSPNGSVTSGSFMRITSASGNRYVRFGARLEF